MRLYDTLSRQKKELPSPEAHPVITFYACGPTVYDDTHIGHMRRYVMDDVLIRSLRYFGYEVSHVMNITDVGHLTGDDDNGEDKLEKGAIKHGKTVWDVAKEYEEQFWKTMTALNITKGDITVLHATDNIPEMIEMIRTLEQKGYTYQTAEAVYFDVTKFEGYGKLSGQNLDEKKQAVREEVQIDPEKKHPADFALWFKRVGRFANHTMHWESPWGEGFPGWHIECSAMSKKGLGTESIDIHSGGIDHIPVHHENEIAQSEGASGKPFVSWWVHHAFLNVDGEKMSKSKENFYSLTDIQKQEIDPVALRLLFMSTSYRKPMNFTWESLRAAQTALRELRSLYLHWNQEMSNVPQEKTTDLSGGSVFFLELFEKAISDDLNITGALGELWYMLRSSDLPPKEKLVLLKKADQILGLDLGRSEQESIVIPDEVIKLAEMREIARQEKDFITSDALRKDIESKGFLIKDTPQGCVITKN